MWKLKSVAFDKYDISSLHVIKDHTRKPRGLCELLSPESEDNNLSDLMLQHRVSKNLRINF